MFGASGGAGINAAKPAGPVNPQKTASPFSPGTKMLKDIEAPPSPFVVSSKCTGNKEMMKKIGHSGNLKNTVGWKPQASPFASNDSAKPQVKTPANTNIK